MVVVPRGQSWDEAVYPGRRNLLVSQGGSIMQLSNDRQGYGSMRVFPGPVAGKFKFQTEGVWRISIFMSIRHNNAGAYREMQARVFNVTDSEGLPPFQIPSGQAATITNFAFSSVYKIPPSILEKELVVQVQGGTGSNYSGVSYETMNLGLSLEGVI
jgi:hypothetical protein